jgi:hypothetical protein
MADRQLHPHAIDFRGEEGLEHSLAGFCGEAGAAVDHRHLDPTFVAVGADDEEARAIRRLGHGLDSVDHQVDHDMLQLHAIAADRRQPRLW